MSTNMYFLFATGIYISVFVLGTKKFGKFGKVPNKVSMLFPFCVSTYGQSTLFPFSLLCQYSCAQKSRNLKCKKAVHETHVQKKLSVKCWWNWPLKLNIQSEINQVLDRGTNFKKKSCCGPQKKILKQKFDLFFFHFIPKRG